MIGRQLSHFYIIRQLGSGGMGVVYEAQDTRLPRSVAIKFLKPTLLPDNGALRRFKREARLASSLNHPNICTIFDVEEGDGQSFIAMELLHGQSLKDRLSGEPLPLDEILDVATQVTDALTAAHDRGIVHRDLKPANVFLTETGLVKLLDFGLAKHLPVHDDDEPVTDDLTVPGAMLGTLQYMAPEQLAADEQVDYRCDLFSLGTLLYEMTTGARPFDGSSKSALISAIRLHPHAPVTQLSPSCPPALGKIIDTLLAKRPDDRYQSVRALRSDLEALDAGPNVPRRREIARAPQTPRPNVKASALRTALSDRYLVGEEVGRGGMATVYAAEDLRHQRRVALKVLDPDLAAMLGAERFLGEIRVTARLQHPNLLPLFDSGDSAGLLYYVMPLVEGASLRARLEREPQLPVNEAVRIATAIASALDYAHRQGVVHRDLKPENILLHDGQPLVADFGIALAVANAGGSHLTAAGVAIGTPRYMSPEQASATAAIDGRSDVYSLASVLYEMLVGDPPFTGSSAQAIIAKVISDPPSSVRTVRPTIPPHVDAALTRALAKLPADRFATAREFADALADTSAISAPVHPPRATAWSRRTPLALGAVAFVAIASVAWIASRSSSTPAEIMQIPYRGLVDHTQFGGVTITPDGRALVYTGSADAGRPLMLWRLDERTPRALPGTERGSSPFVTPDGDRLVFTTDEDALQTVAIGREPSSNAAASATRLGHFLHRMVSPEGWRFGNGAWIDGTDVVTEVASPILRIGVPGEPTLSVLTKLDSTRGETNHLAALVLPGKRAVVFTVGSRVGRGLVTGPLAIASLDARTPATPAPHAYLSVKGRRAVAFVDGWLLYTSENGKAIMAVRLDVERQRTVGNPIAVLEDDSGELEAASLADNGTLLYVRRPTMKSAVFVNASGAARPEMASPAGVFMNPRLSPDGKRLAVQVASSHGEDVWLYDVASGTRTALTSTGRALQPTWTPDGRRVVFLAGRAAGLMWQPVDGSAPAEKIPGTENAMGPTVAPDGKSVVFQRTRPGGGTIWSAPLGVPGTLRKLIDDPFHNTIPAISPDGAWLAYVSNATGRKEVWVRPFPGPGLSVQVSDSGGTEPAWSPKGDVIYYRGSGTLIAATVKPSTTAPTRELVIGARTPQFKDVSDNTMPHRDYDVSPDGNGFLTVVPPTPDAYLVLNWLAKLRERLARER